MKPERIEDLAGTVVKGPFGTGSKSERDAVYLDTPRGRFVLRRKDGPTFGDPELERWIGRRVVCDGFLLPSPPTLLAERIRPDESS